MREFMKRFTRVISLAAALLTLLTASTVHAASNGLGITPRRDFTVQPGKSVTDTLYISNLSLNQDLQVDMKVIDFGAADETGTPALQLGDNAPQTAWSLKPFIKLQQGTKIAAGKSANVPVTITIPAGQGAGSYYSAIQYTAVNPETKQRVNIAASTASLLFVTVPGDAKEKLDLTKFGAWQSQSPAEQPTEGSFTSLFTSSVPKELAYKLKNSGNIAEQPNGSMLIKNMFGHTVKEIQDANPKKQLVLIGQERRIQVCMKTSVLESKDPNGQQTQQSTCDDPGLLPGRYTAEVALFYGLNGNSTQEVVAKTSFWYIPWWSLIVLLVLVLFIVGLIWLIRRAFGNRSRRYHR
jgi:hypothetical protein